MHITLSSLYREQQTTGPKFKNARTHSRGPIQGQSEHSTAEIYNQQWTQRVSTC